MPAKPTIDPSIKTFTHAFFWAICLYLLTACGSLERSLSPDLNSSQPALILTFQDWSISKSRKQVAPGPLTFLLRNRSNRTHEFVMIRLDDATSHIQTHHERLDEDLFSEEQVIADLEGLPPGSELTHDVRLTPGTYLIFCNVVEKKGTQVINHFGKGMSTTLTVE